MNKKRIVCIATVVCFISLKISTISLADEKNDSSNNERYEKQTTSTEDLSVRVVSGKWIKDSKGWWYRHNDGSYTTNDWEYIAGEWYYFNKQGYMQTGWISVGGKWYYLNSSGAMQTGWVSVGGKWYYLNSSGAMQTGWISVGGKWYYLNSSGAMQTGWISVEGKRYYLNSSGAMQTGCISVGGKWYYLNSSGAMQTEKTKRVDKEFRTMFPVVEGGWSVATVSLGYTEKYIKVGNYGHYVEHHESEVYKCSGSTAVPQVYINILKYSDGTEVYPWEQGDFIYDAVKWDVGLLYKNYNKYSFVTSTNVQGIVTGSIYCEGAIIPTVAISVSQKLSIL